MRFFRNHIVVRAFGLFMSVYILNISIDAPDSQPDHKAEDVSINDIESIAELLLEELMEIDDAIPEHDESDSNESTMILKKSFDFFCMDFKKNMDYVSDLLLKNPFLAFEKNFYQQFFPEFNTPPPEA